MTTPFVTLRRRFQDSRIVVVAASLGLLFGIGCLGTQSDLSPDAGVEVDAGAADAGVDLRCAEKCAGRPGCEAIDGLRWDDDASCFDLAFADCDVPEPQPEGSDNWEGPDGDCWAGEAGNWWPPSAWVTSPCHQLGAYCSEEE